MAHLYTWHIRNIKLFNMEEGWDEGGGIAFATTMRQNGLILVLASSSSSSSVYKTSNLYYIVETIFIMEVLSLINNIIQPHGCVSCYI